MVDVLPGALTGSEAERQKPKVGFLPLPGPPLRLKSPRLQLALITLLALVLRVIQLDAQPLWWDEGYSIFFATRTFGEMLARTAVAVTVEPEALLGPALLAVIV